MTFVNIMENSIFRKTTFRWASLRDTRIVPVSLLSLKFSNFQEINTLRAWALFLQLKFVSKFLYMERMQICGKTAFKKPERNSGGKYNHKIDNFSLISNMYLRL